MQPPFDTGFEGIGRVVEMGEDCKGFQLGDPVVFMHAGSFSEYMTLPQRRAVLIPREDPAEALMPAYLTRMSSSWDPARGVEMV